ncbi:unnamed protein product [marine sediment metagenome]|uniref:HTH cro/C1-type domain-containing protein n=1 Tax=marine sediment metagenome TaxID=412755 RepID=X1PPA1_9ZZZZ
MNQHPIFTKYRRQYLYQATGYSLGLLSRVATGKMPASRPFIERVCYRLGEPEEALFLPDDPPDDPPVDIESSVGQWLRERCQEEHLTSRQAAARTDLSHATIRDTINGTRPDPQTIRKLALGFANGTAERLALEDELLVRAGHRTPRPEEEFNEPLTQLIDAVAGFDKPRLKLMQDVASLIVEIGAKNA